MPGTISAADHLRRSALPSDDRRRALDLLLTLAAVECHASVGGAAMVPPGLLRDLVIITGRLAGRAWLEADADRRPAVPAGNNALRFLTVDLTRGLSSPTLQITAR